MRSDKDLIDAVIAWAADKEGQPSGVADARLLKAIWTYEGDNVGACPGCDGECDEPCRPSTVAEAHASLDRYIAKQTGRT